MGILQDFFSGNFSGAYEDIVKSIQKLPTNVQNFISALETEEGQIMQNLVNVAVKDVEAGGFSTVSFIQAGKDVLTQLIAQEITVFSIQNIIAMLNIAATPLVTASTTTAPTT